MSAQWPAGRPNPPVLPIIFVTLLLDALALGMIRPVLPGLVRTLSGGTAVEEAQLFGLAETGWALSQLLLAPLMGILADRFGRRPLILGSNLALGLDYLLMAATPNLAWLMVGRTLSGVAAGTFCAAGAVIADVTRPERRAAGFGVLGAAIGGGFGLGPILGGILGDLDPRLPFWAAAGLLIANFGWAWLVLPETLAPKRRTPIRWRDAHPLAALQFVGARRPLIRLAIVALLAFVAMEVLPVAFVLFAQHRFDWPPGTVGLALSSVGISLGLVQYALVPPVVERIGERRAALAGLVFGTVGLAALGLVPAAGWVWWCFPVIAVWGIFVPSVQSLMTHHASDREQGQLQGVIGSLHTLSRLVASALFTSVFALAIAPGLPAWWAGSPFVLAAAVLAAALALSMRWERAPAP